MFTEVSLGGDRVNPSRRRTTLLPGPAMERQRQVPQDQHCAVSSRAGEAHEKVLISARRLLYAIRPLDTAARGLS